MCNVGARFFSELENGKETLQMNKVLHCLEMLGINLYAVNREDDDEDLLSKEASYKLDSNNYELLDGNRLSEFIEKMNTRPLIKADDKLRLWRLRSS